MPHKSRSCGGLNPAYYKKPRLGTVDNPELSHLRRSAFHTLLIATTLVAAVLGLIVWMR